MLAHLMRRSYCRLLSCRSHEGLEEQIAYRPEWFQNSANLPDPSFARSEWKADFYTCIIRIWLANLEES